MTPTFPDRNTQPGSGDVPWNPSPSSSNPLSSQIPLLNPTHIPVSAPTHITNNSAPIVFQNGIGSNPYRWSSSVNSTHAGPSEIDFTNNPFSLDDPLGTKSLSDNLSELNLLDDRPRPTKIRRRNALTILDQHYPNLNSVQSKDTQAILETPTPSSDAFESASLLQSLSDGVELVDVSLDEWQQPKRYISFLLY